MAIPKINDKNKKIVIYRDFDMNFVSHDITNDVVVNVDERSVMQSVKNLLLTSKGERVFRPDIGGDLKQFIFENKYNSSINKLIEIHVTDTINTYEPRIKLEKVIVESSLDDNNLVLKLYYYIRNSEKLNVSTITLEKIR
jgi:phage baseplate assembly protein W